MKTKQLGSITQETLQTMNDNIRSMRLDLVLIDNDVTNELDNLLHQAQQEIIHILLQNHNKGEQ